MQAFKILLLLLALPHVAFCGDWSCWWYTTPDGNTICRDWYRYDECIMIKCGQKYDEERDYRTVVDHVERWYLYRHHILGNYWQNGVQRYFIFNETDCVCQTFDNIQAFDESLTAHHLKPMFWTRWYDDSDMDDYLSLPNLSFLFYLPFLGLLAVLSIIQLIRTRFSPKDRFNQLSFLFFCFLLLWRWLWLNSHPQSF